MACAARPTTRLAAARASAHTARIANGLAPPGDTSGAIAKRATIDATSEANPAKPVSMSSPSLVDPTASIPFASCIMLPDTVLRQPDRGIFIYDGLLHEIHQILPGMGPCLPVDVVDMGLGRMREMKSCFCTYSALRPLASIWSTSV